MEPYDLAVVGGGVVGCAVAREASKYELSCALLEAKADVGAGTSKANTAIWHTGFDAKTGTLEQRLLARSYMLLLDYVPDRGIPHEKTGAVLIAWDEDQLASLEGIVEKAHANGVADVRLLSVEEVYELEPHVNRDALGGVMVPGESIICPFTVPLSYAYEAVMNGARLYREFPVGKIEEDGGVHVLSGPGGEVKARFVVNAAGLNSDVIDGMFGFDRFHVTPRRGELIVFDKLSRPLVNHVLLPVPTERTKGVLVSPTVFGNIMVGPTAEDLEDKEATCTSKAGLEYLWAKGEAIVSKLMKEEVTCTYAGLRAATEFKDYQVFSHPEKRYLCLGGIRSTGLSASLGIAEYAMELLAEAGLSLEEKKEFRKVRMPYIGQKEKRPYQSEEKIREDPDFGRVVCHCERVTLGEIRRALRSPVPPGTLEGLKRRTRCMQGRCQGFYCSADVAHVFQTEAQKEDHPGEASHE